MNIIQIYKQFPTETDCIKHLEQVRWSGEPTCPYCQSKRATPHKNEHRYQCNNCKTAFSVTVGTIFHRTHLDLQKWFLAITLVLNAKKGYSARQLGRDIEVTKDTAWRMFMQIRRAFVSDQKLLEGIVEADETFIGGKNKNRHADKKKDGGQGGADKTVVIGVKERNGDVRAKKATDRSQKTLTKFVNANVKKGSTLSTDEWRGYNKLSMKFNHLIVNHSAGQYVSGDAHTNGMENFWSLFKRGIVGQYHQISERYMDKYLNEFCFRYNNRENPEVFNLVINRSVNI